MLLTERRVRREENEKIFRAFFLGHRSDGHPISPSGYLFVPGLANQNGKLAPKLASPKDLPASYPANPKMKQPSVNLQEQTAVAFLSKIRAAYIIPPMPPGIPPPIGASFFSGKSVITTSVVKSMAAAEAAF